MKKKNPRSRALAHRRVRTLTEADVRSAQEKVRVVMVCFGCLLDHVLGIKELPENELRNLFR